MLETEIKKLTTALEANTAALLGGASAAPTNTPTAATIPAASAQPPVTPPIPNTAPPATVAAIPGAAAIPPQPGAVVQPMTHQQAQVELGAIVQALGGGAQVQATMAQYGSVRLNEIPAENLFSLVQACKALIVA